MKDEREGDGDAFCCGDGTGVAFWLTACSIRTGDISLSVVAMVLNVHNAALFMHKLANGLPDD